MLKYAYRSHKGLIREKNEDSFFVPSSSSSSPGRVFAVADGMGGHVGGEVASSLTIKTLSNYLPEIQRNFSQENWGEMQQIVENIVIEANNNLLEKQRLQPELQGMGTTLTVAVFGKEDLVIGHVGDSQVHLFNDQGHFQVTEDHSMAAELLKNGKINREDVLTHPQKHVLTRVLGSSPALKIDLYVRKVNKGDLFLICTDGLTDMLFPEEIEGIIKQNVDLELRAEKLVEEANDRGGTDNLTFILVHIL